MSCIIYGPGMFGSTLEYVLSNLQSAIRLDTDAICSDGSLHSFAKSAHVWQHEDFKLLDDLSTSEFATIIYPNNTQKFADIVSALPARHSNQNIVVYSQSRRSSEINLLFQYYKISVGADPNWSQGLNNFSQSADYTKWNSDYTKWQDMQPWEWREWFSHYYSGLCNEWENVSTDWRKINCNDILTDFSNVIHQLCYYYNIDLCKEQRHNLKEFARMWTAKQQYVVDEYTTIENVVRSLRDDAYFEWGSLSPISEAIIQKRLRQQGFEIKCQDLNEFPITTKDLQSLLYRAIV